MITDGVNVFILDPAPFFLLPALIGSTVFTIGWWWLFCHPRHPRRRPRRKDQR